MAVPQPGHAQLASRPRSPRLKKRDAESFRARRFSKGRSHVKEPGGEGEAGAAPRLWATRERSAPRRTPAQRAPRCPLVELGASRSRGLRASPSTQALQQTAGGELEPMPEWDDPPDTPSYQRAWGCWVSLIHFFNWRKGAHRRPLAHSDSR